MTDETLPVEGISDLEAGSTDLTRVVLESRKKAAGPLASWFVGDLGEDHLRELLKVAFQLSFRKDEARYPRFTIFVPSRKEAQSTDTASIVFDPPVPFQVHTLRKLAPAVPPRPYAMLVRVVDEGLVCSSIGRFETAGALLPEGQTGFYLRGEGLTLEVLGPGDLAIHEAGEVHTLRAGQISRQYNGNKSLGCLPQFDDLVRELAEQAFGKVEDVTRKKVAAALQDAWMHVLKSAVALGHGGSFALLPADAASVAELPAEWHDRIFTAFPTRAPDLLGHVGSYVKSRWGAGAAPRLVTLRQVTDAAFAISRLSATDGFVLLNRHLLVIGCGARIGWDDPLPDSCVEVDELLRPTGDRYDLARIGTRHSAAYRLCHAIPGAVAFVVSQDAELRVFFTEEDVRVTAPLAPITYLFQGM